MKFSTWGSASEISILKPIISDFEKQNPDIKIELIHIPQDYFQKIHLLFASNLAPDVIFINNINLPIYVNYLVDLSDVVENENFYKQSLEALSAYSKLYAVPRDVSNLVIYYNKSLFRKAGVPYPNKDWTIDDMISVAKRLTTNATWGLSYEPQIYYALPYMNYYNGGIFDENLRYIANNENSSRGINLYKNLAYKYHYAPEPSEIGSKTVAQMFLEGKIAMHLSGRWLVPKYRACAKFDWNVINFPGYTVPCDASGWAISKSSKHTSEAKKFVLFLSSQENIKKMTRDGLIVPARIDVSKSDVFLSGLPESSEVFLDTVKLSKKNPIPKDYSRIIDKLNDTVFNTK